MAERKEKVANQLKELAASFFIKESWKDSILTVTDARISKDFKRATILFTAFPENKEEAALYFLKRRSGELRDYLKEKMSMKNIPHIEVEIDKGEKNRQRIDGLLRSS